MRVVIEFGPLGQWSGTLHANAPAGRTSPFEGRLDLLRQLETLVDGSDADGQEATGSG